MAKQLEDRSLTELRARASAMGIEVNFADDKRKLIESIRSDIAEKTPPRPIMVAIEPTVPGKAPGSIIKRNLTQDEVTESLKHMTERGLILTFPTSMSWHMQRDKKSDSGTMSMPLLGIVRCATQVMK